MTIKSLNRSLAKQDPEGTFGNPFGMVKKDCSPEVRR